MNKQELKELKENNTHIPWSIFDKINAKNYEVFEENIDEISEDKPVLLYIPNANAYSTISETLRKSQRLLFVLLNKYHTISENIISGWLKSVAYIRDYKTQKTILKTRKFITNDAFYLKDWQSWALLIRKPQKWKQQ